VLIHRQDTDGDPAAQAYRTTTAGSRPPRPGRRRVIYDTVIHDTNRPLVNGKPLPPGVTMEDWMRLHFAPGFYHWLNAVRGCQTGVYWRLTDKVGR
jgi:hypothetical protein